MKRDWKGAGKLLITEMARMSVIAAGVFIIGYLPGIISWKITLGVYLGIAAIIHVLLFLTFNGKLSLSDFKEYFGDGGVVIIVLLWPGSFFLAIAPEMTENFFRRKLGLPPQKPGY